MLTGYILTEPFLLRISDFTGNDFTSARIDRMTYQVAGSYQIEAIEAINDMDYYITSETNILGEATLMRVNTDLVVGTKNPFTSDIRIFPNPVTRLLEISGLQNPGETGMSLINTMGKQVFYHKTVTTIPYESIKYDLTGVPGGFYLMRFTAQGVDISCKLIIGQTGF